jgi:hypothetical protein
VYGYGVVLLELLTGQVAIDHNRAEDYNLVSWVSLSLKLFKGTFKNYRIIKFAEKCFRFHDNVLDDKAPSMMVLVRAHE